MLVEETHATVTWSDGASIRGVTVVWTEPEDRAAFEGWAASSARAYPQHFVLADRDEALALSSPWRGILFAPHDVTPGGISERAVLEFRGHEYSIVTLTPRVSSAAWLAGLDRPCLEVAFAGLDGERPNRE